MRRVAPYCLWLGHVGDVRDLRGIIDQGIRAVVDLALNEPPAAVTRELVYCRFPLVDGIGNPAWLVRSAVGTVARLLRERVQTLVYCGGGMSRSPVIAAAALAEFEGRSLEDCMAIVTASGIADVSPALLSCIKESLG
jgi:hypothetical protein